MQMLQHSSTVMRCDLATSGLAIKASRAECVMPNDAPKDEAGGGAAHGACTGARVQQVPDVVVVDLQKLALHLYMLQYPDAWTAGRPVH